MKSSPRTLSASARAWNPPDLTVDSAPLPQAPQKERVLSIFQREDDSERQSVSKRSALHRKADSDFAAWQPGQFGQQPQAAPLDVWSFVDIAEPAFEELRKPQVVQFRAEAQLRQETSAAESQIAAQLERARLQAEEIILNAQAEADDILAQVQSEIDEQKRLGYQQGRDQARAELEDALKVAHSLVGQVESWKNELTSQGEHILIEMLKDMARKIFGDGVRLDPQALHINLDRVMESAHGLGSLNIFLNPEDAKILDATWKEQQALILGEQVKVIPSASITRGGCLIKGNLGTVDGRVETQLASILNSFDEAAV